MGPSEESRRAVAGIGGTRGAYAILAHRGHGAIFSLGRISTARVEERPVTHGRIPCSARATTPTPPCRAFFRNTVTRGGRSAGTVLSLVVGLQAVSGVAPPPNVSGGTTASGGSFFRFRKSSRKPSDGRVSVTPSSRAGAQAVAFANGGGSVGPVSSRKTLIV